MALTAKKVFAILNRKIENGGVTDEKIENVVNNYLENNPIQPGATKEQAAQIQENTEALNGLKFSVNEEKNCLQVTYE